MNNHQKVFSISMKDFETIWKHIECGIAVIDEETREILNVNPVTARMFGAPAEELIGKHCQKVFCPADLCPIIDEKQKVDRSERKFLNANGETILILKSVAKINYNGRPALLESFIDLSPAKEAEKILRISQVSDHAHRAKRDFLAKMSHDMLTPMNAIMGMTQTAKGSTDLNELAYCLDIIEDSGAQLLGMISDVLDMSMIEAGKFELNHVSINIEKTLINICNLINEKIEEKNIKLTIKFGRDMKMNYMGDDRKLSKAITNILSNAVKFTPNKGKIEIEVCETETEDSCSVLRFVVKDTGIGMEKDQMESIFRAFEQAEINISRSFGGMGLGLSIAKNIVEKMDGKIWVESQPGIGSSFSFEVRLEHSENQNGSIIFRHIRPSDVNLLIISSDNETRSYFKSIAGRFGINADEAETVERAESLVKLARASGKPYDIIFSEYGVPDLDGVSAAKKVKQLINKNTAIVVITSPKKWEIIKRYAQECIGVDRFIPTPLFPSVILDSINEIISSMVKRFDIISEQTKDMPDFSGVTLILTEDVEINRELFASVFEGTNLKVEFAENGKIVVEKIKRNPDIYDMILMDINMPVMNGYEATKAIRALNSEKAKNIPIVALTAEVLKEDIEKCLANGMNDHLSKPINIGAVCEKILMYAKK
jgi:PAS domain S-box-containing protein